MKVKKLTELFMLRLSAEEREKLHRVAGELGMNDATVARLSLRYGLTTVRRKLPVAPVIAEAPGE